MSDKQSLSEIRESLNKALDDAKNIMELADRNVVYAYSYVLLGLGDSLRGGKEQNPPPGQQNVAYDDLLNAIQQIIFQATAVQSRGLCWQRFLDGTAAVRQQLQNKDNLTYQQLQQLYAEIGHAFAEFNKCLLLPRSKIPV